MKFQFRVLIFIFIIFSVTPCFARVITIYHQDKIENAIEVAKIFQEKYSVPSKLIQIVKKSKCLETTESLLELCINKKGELLTLSSNISLFQRSIKIFNIPTEEVL